MGKFLFLNGHYQLDLFLELPQVLYELTTVSGKVVDLVIVHLDFSGVTHLIHRHYFSEATQQLVCSHSWQIMQLLHEVTLWSDEGLEFS